MENDNKTSLIKKADSLLKFDPQKKKELIIRGLKETGLIKTILLLDSDKNIHSLVDEELREAFGNQIRLVHFYTPTDAFNYLISNDVHLVISCILLSDTNLMGTYSGTTFLRVFKALYSKVPFVLFTALDIYTDHLTKAPDAYIVKSSDFSELIQAVENLLSVGISTEEYNFQIRNKDIDTLLKLGYAYANLGRDKDAIEIFQKIIQINPKIAYAHYGLALYLSEEMYEKQLEHFKEAIKLKPDFKEAYSSIGYIYYEIGMYPEALEAYTQVTKITPHDVGAFDKIASIYTKLSMFREAIEAYKKIIKIKPEHYKHDIFYSTPRWDDFQKSEGFFIEPGKKPLGNDPQEIDDKEIDDKVQAVMIHYYSSAYFGIGVGYYNLGMYSEAIEAFRQAINVRPASASAYYNLGLAYLFSGQKSMALEQYQELKKIDKTLAEELFTQIYR
jgi:tetratricopeptide (TPR) repeat protein